MHADIVTQQYVSSYCGNVEKDQKVDPNLTTILFSPVTSVPPFN